MSSWAAGATPARDRGPSATTHDRDGPQVPRASRFSSHLRGSRDECCYCSAFCTGAGLFSASAISSSNSSQAVGREPRHLRPPAHDLLHRHDLGVPLRGRFPGGHCVRLAGHEGVPALTRGESVELLAHVPRALLGRGQQAGLVERPGPHLAQHTLGKRFLRDLELRLRRHHTLDSVPRHRSGLVAGSPSFAICLGSYRTTPRDGLGSEFRRGGG